MIFFLIALTVAFIILPTLFSKDRTGTLITTAVLSLNLWLLGAFAFVAIHFISKYW